MGPEAQKAWGAYYTDPAVAMFLVRWALRSPTDRVLDPGCGDGVFLRAAAEHLGALGSCPASRITGVEADPQVHRETSRTLCLGGILPPDALICDDFFALHPAKLGRFTAVVGNPPFIRYQRFNGARRSLALKRAFEAGVELTALTSAWAPFIIHAATFLDPGGRLATVAPAELCHAAYARPVLHFLRQRFCHVRVLTFAKRLFPHLNEDTVLVLGEGYGQAGSNLRLVSLHDMSSLSQADAMSLDGCPVDIQRVERGLIRPIAYLLPPQVRQLYQKLSRHPRVIRLETVAAAGIGYVTGDNEFFHLSASEVHQLRISSKLLSPAICRGAWLTGLAFTKRDWNRLDREGRKAWLLNLAGVRGPLPKWVLEYLRAGERRKIHMAYKCRVRDPWYAVPHVSVPDLFLTYMANLRPILALNRAKAVAPNTLLCVKLDPMTKVSGGALAAAWWTSLTALSTELEGHSLGGGMLKLEPGEAGRVLLPLPPFLSQLSRARKLVADLDTLVRLEAYEEALDLGDEQILRRGLGLSKGDCALLRQGLTFFVNRRRSR